MYGRRNQRSATEVYIIGIIIRPSHGNVFRTVIRSFEDFVVINLIKLLNKQSSRPWFLTRWHSCDVSATIVTHRSGFQLKRGPILYHLLENWFTDWDQQHLWHGKSIYDHILYHSNTTKTYHWRMIDRVITAIDYITMRVRNPWPPSKHISPGYRIVSPTRESSIWDVPCDGEIILWGLRTYVWLHLKERQNVRQTRRALWCCQSYFHGNRVSLLQNQSW